MPPLALSALLQEMVAGGENSYLSSLYKALPQNQDDLTREFGSDLYERIALDPDVAPALDILTLGALADGVRLTPSHHPPARRERKPDPRAKGDAEAAKRMLDFVQRRLDAMETPLEMVAKGLLEGVAMGHKVAEIVWEPILTGEDRGRLGVRAVKCRPRKNLVFVLDHYNNLVGMFVATPRTVTSGVVKAGGPVADPFAEPSFVPRWRFVVFTHEPKDGDPKGTALLASVYNLWVFKTQVLPEWWNHLRRHGTGSIVGKVGQGDETTAKVDEETGERALDADGNPVMVRKTAALMVQLLRFLGGSAIALPLDAEVEMLESKNTGEVFTRALDYLGRQIHQVILRTARATKEAANASRSDTETAQDITGLVVAWIKRTLAHCLQRDLVETLVRLNFGEEAMRHAPRVTLARAERQDKAQLITAYNDTWKSGMLHFTALPGVYEECDIPEPDWEAWALEREEGRDLERQMAGLRNDLLNPAPDDEEDPKDGT